MNKTSERKWYINLLFCLISLIGIIVIPSLFFVILKNIITNENINDLVSSFLFIGVLVFFYYKDLIVEFKRFKNNFKFSIKTGFKYYIVGIMGMIFFNLIIVFVLKNISSNENQVRDMLYSSPIFTMINIMIIAPLSEELVFRKSIQPLTSNKYLYAIICGLLFGGAHLLTNVMTGTFVLSDLLYILPYGSLGFVFALMDYDTKSTCTSMFMHFLHNTVTGIVLLLAYFGGNI